MSQAKKRPTPDEGLLEKVGVAQLLAEAWGTRRSGRLRVARGKIECWIQVVDGAPVAIDTKGEPDHFARSLETAGQIQPAERRKLEQFAVEHECSQASGALALKLLDPGTLYQAIRVRARQQIAETLEWQAGAYQWSALAAAPPANAKPHDILSLVQTELPRRWGSERLFAAVLAISEAYADISPRLRRVALKLGEAGPTAAKVVERLDGSRPLGRILGEAAGDTLAASTIWTLWHAGILRLSDAALLRSVGSAVPLEVEFEVEVSLDPRAAETMSAGRDLPTQDSAASPLDPETAALRDDIESLSSKLGKLDYYAVLGLDSSANTAAIKKAYFKAAKRYHPDALARKGLAGLEEKAARVFGRVSEAFETLTDPDKRASYDRGASGEPEIDTARLAQAETSYRKGEILIKMGNFQGALEYLQPAVDLWPEEPAYQSALGWALYKQPASDTRRAREHLERAHRQAPGDAITMFRLGMVLRALGEAEAGATLIARARSLESSLTG